MAAFSRRRFERLRHPPVVRFGIPHLTRRESARVDLKVINAPFDVRPGVDIVVTVGGGETLARRSTDGGVDAQAQGEGVEVRAEGLHALREPLGVGDLPARRRIAGTRQPAVVDDDVFVDVEEGRVGGYRRGGRAD